MSDQNRDRDAAIQRLKAKRDFRWHLVTYVVVNIFMIGIWLLGSRIGFWPVWVILPWGIAVAFHGWWAYFAQPFSETDIRREIGRDE